MLARVRNFCGSSSGKVVPRQGAVRICGALGIDPRKAKKIINKNALRETSGLGPIKLHWCSFRRNSFVNAGRQNDCANSKIQTTKIAHFGVRKFVLRLCIRDFSTSYRRRRLCSAEKSGILVRLKPTVRQVRGDDCDRSSSS
ncbi:MAG: hypothetical protein JWM36_2462 [Hyphomicrobiales bacterium]|nr:hypothetical protein [Hyphomicrobiales bacterium]